MERELDERRKGMVIHRVCVSAVIGVLLSAGMSGAAEKKMVPYSTRWNVKLTSLTPEEVLTK